MHPDSVLLPECPLFDGIEANHLSAMAGCLGAKTVFVKKNAPLLSEGAPARNIGILLTGRAQIIRTHYYGNRSIIMNVEAGQLFGEAFACADVESLPISVIAAEDSSALMIDCRRIMTTCSNACEFHSRLIYNLLKIVSRKNLALHQKAEITSCRTTREKLMTYLLLQAKQAGSARFTIPFDRQGLADFLEVARSGLCAEISKLKKQGALDYHKNSSHLLNPGRAD